MKFTTDLPADYINEHTARYALYHPPVPNAESVDWRMVDRQWQQVKGPDLAKQAGDVRVTLGFMLGLCRNLFFAHRDLRENNDWTKRGGFQLTGRTVGIIGVGFVGRDLIELLKPFNCRILVNDVVEQTAYYEANGLIEASKDRIYAEADIVTVHTPLDSMTRGMIDIDVFRKMKRSAYLINAARGPIVVQSDLKRALTEGMIAGAALDVFEIEPCDDPKFMALPNLYCTPHTGGSADESILAMGRSAIAHLASFFKDRN